MAPIDEADVFLSDEKLNKMSVAELEDVLAQKDELIRLLKEERDYLSSRTDLDDRIGVLENVLTTLPKGAQLKVKAQMLKDVQQSIHDHHEEIVQKHHEEQK